MQPIRTIIPAVAAALASVAAHAGQLTVVDTTPPARHLSALPGGDIAVQFDRPVDPDTVSPDSFWAFARWSGAVGGGYSLTDGGTRVILSPDRVLSSGEMVTVYLSHDLRGTDGTSLRTLEQLTESESPDISLKQDVSAPTPESQLARAQIWEVVQGIIQTQLTERQRTALTRVVFDGAPVEVVAEQLNTNRNNIYKIVHDARKKLKRELEERDWSADEVLQAFEPSSGE